MSRKDLEKAALSPEPIDPKGFNPEDTWLLACMFDSNRPADATTGVDPKPFGFIRVAGARLERTDWTFSGRSCASRRTITASVNDSGYRKIMENWIYGSPEERTGPSR